MRVLLLSQSYVPHKVISWQRAVLLWFANKVEVLESYDEDLRSPSVTLKMPAVIRLLRPVARVRRSIKFSRMNVFARDFYCCQYCGQTKRTNELNYDHVVPRHQGGKTNWENVVSSCYACNSRKRNRTPEQAGMRLLRRPSRPAVLPVKPPQLEPQDIPPAWAEWCRELV